MKRYAIIKSVEVFDGEEKIGEVNYEDGLGYKAKLEDTFMSSSDIVFVSKVLDKLEENEELEVEDETR